MRIIKASAFLATIGLILAGCSSIEGRPAGAPPLKTMTYIDPQKYVGLWYEIARYPNSFERNCINVTAQYTLLENGDVGVINTCTDEKSGKVKSAKAKATIIKGSNNTALAVNFAPFPLPKGNGNYHILYTDNDYSIALVGSPSGKYLWLLSRTPKIDLPKLNTLLEIAKENQFDVSKLEYVSQK